VAVAAAPGAAAAAAPVEEKTEFTVTLKEYPADKKVTVIKVIREIRGPGLEGSQRPRRGRALASSRKASTRPIRKPLKKKLEDAGAKVEIK